MNQTAKMRLRSQSAMEYLMTYGWAILIIAIVLGALFQLGVFNSTNFSPRVPPGSCRVARLAGTVNLEGVCSGQLPQFVAQFNGQSSYISAVKVNPPTYLTVSVWINWNAVYSDSGGHAIVSESDSATDGYMLYQATYSPYNHVAYFVYGATGGLGQGTSVASMQTGVWYNLIMTYDGAKVTLYVNGVIDSNTPTTGGISPANNNFIIGSSYTAGGSIFNGRLANVQIYNASLPTSSIQALYLEGIGGAPVQPQNLVGWWPLNADTNDYGGNGNNGVPTNVVYTNQWLSGYSIP